MMMNILICAICLVVGFGLIRYPMVARELVGRVSIAEKIFMGGSLSFFKALGVVIILVGLMVLTGVDEILIPTVLNAIFPA